MSWRQHRERDALAHAMGYIDQTQDRHLPADYTGDILLWDIDKTYLDTHFSSWRGLAAIPFEFAIDKHPIPGAVPLLRALRRGGHAAGEADLSARQWVPLYFVSGSPPQLRRVIERRMLMDGIEFDGLTFKDQWALLRHGHPSALRQQVGYKLLALLMYASQLPQGASWLCFGDDVESDADVFVLFGDVCAGLRGADLRTRLRSHRVSALFLKPILMMADRVGLKHNPVKGIFIHLSKGDDPDRFNHPLVIATHSFYQTAWVLAGMGRITLADVHTVEADLLRHGVGDEVLHDQREDIVQRCGLCRFEM